MKKLYSFLLFIVTVFFSTSMVQASGWKQPADSDTKALVGELYTVEYETGVWHNTTQYCDIDITDPDGTKIHHETLKFSGIGDIIKSSFTPSKTGEYTLSATCYYYITNQQWNGFSMRSFTTKSIDNTRTTTLNVVNQLWTPPTASSTTSQSYTDEVEPGEPGINPNWEVVPSSSNPGYYIIPDQFEYTVNLKQSSTVRIGFTMYTFRKEKHAFYADSISDASILKYENHSAPLKENSDGIYSGDGYVEYKCLKPGTANLYMCILVNAKAYNLHKVTIHVTESDSAEETSSTTTPDIGNLTYKIVGSQATVTKTKNVKTITIPHGYNCCHGKYGKHKQRKHKPHIQPLLLPRARLFLKRKDITGVCGT